MIRSRDFRATSIRPAVWIGIAASIVLVLLIAYFGPSFLVHQQGSLSAEQRLKAANDARTSLAAVLSAAGLVGTLFFAARTFMLSRTGQNTDRYQAGIRQLGDDCPTVRIGGIYALEKLAKDVDWTRQTISDVLVSFVYQNTSKPLRGHQSHPKVWPQLPPADVQAALTVLGRRTRRTPLRPLNLSGLTLTGADLRRARLEGVQLERTQLERANFTDASLHLAVLRNARLADAILSNANLSDADLTDADLRNATLYRTDFANATLTRCCLAGCDLSSARNLSEGQLRDARERTTNSRGRRQASPS